jgi:hypothetical protein
MTVNCHKQDTETPNDINKEVSLEVNTAHVDVTSPECREKS